MFSLPKLLVLAAIVAAVIYGYRLYAAIDRDRRSAVQKKPERDPAEPRRVEAEDLEKCPRCGTYVAAGAKHDCAGKG